MRRGFDYDIGFVFQQLVERGHERDVVFSRQRFATRSTAATDDSDDFSVAEIAALDVFEEEARNGTAADDCYTHKPPMEVRTPLCHNQRAF